jgi:putative transposase
LRTNPGCPWENGCIESFNSKLRDEVLNGEVFGCLREAQCVLRDWQDRFNNIRPHSALNYQTPNSFTARRETAA